MSSRLSHEEYVEKMRTAKPNILVLGEYEYMYGKLSFKCKDCGHEWITTAYSALYAQYKCPKCAAVKPKRMKTHESFLKEMSGFHPTIKVLEEYKGRKAKIKFKCTVCGNIWEAIPDSLINQKTGCPNCSNKRAGEKLKLTQHEFEKKMHEIHPSIEVIGKYEVTTKKVRFKCKKCGKIWDAVPNRVVSGALNGCPKCPVIAKTKTHEEFMVKMREIHPTIKVKSKYTNTDAKVDLECLSCGHKWKATPANLINKKSGCRICSTTSKGEKEVSEILTRNKITFIREYRFDDCVGKYRLAFDFYIPKEHCCIEFDGKQHFEPVEHFGGEEAFNIYKSRDKIKDDYCKAKNIKLIRIPYYTKNIEESLLSSLSAV